MMFSFVEERLCKRLVQLCFCLLMPCSFVEPVFVRLGNESRADAFKVCHKPIAQGKRAQPRALRAHCNGKKETNSFRQGRLRGCGKRSDKQVHRKTHVIGELFIAASCSTDVCGSTKIVRLRELANNLGLCSGKKVFFLTKKVLRCSKLGTMSVDSNPSALTDTDSDGSNDDELSLALTAASRRVPQRSSSPLAASVRRKRRRAGTEPPPSWNKAKKGNDAVGRKDSSESGGEEQKQSVRETGAGEIM